jgi:NCAIR mutase (PurE)-related protein
MDERALGLHLDRDRELRTGHAEAVYGPGKSPEQVAVAVETLVRHATGAVFVTKATNEQFLAVCDFLPNAAYAEEARLIVAKWAEMDPSLESVAVVTAGASDHAVAEEAAVTAGALGLTVERISDVGVAGLHRVIGRRDQIEGAGCVIVVAGMEGALPSVVAGLTSRPVLAVPTSVGYGASFDGIAALLAMLSSCAPGVSVVNIDNGFGAALAAHRILRAASRVSTPAVPGR